TAGHKHTFTRDKVERLRANLSTLSLNVITLGDTPSTLPPNVMTLRGNPSTLGDKLSSLRPNVMTLRG
ncbi:MAG: hypothetical protein ACJ74T_14480, partial [Pyrinomonadaceae bacterium]